MHLGGLGWCKVTFDGDTIVAKHDPEPDPSDIKYVSSYKDGVITVTPLLNDKPLFLKIK